MPSADTGPVARKPKKPARKAARPKPRKAARPKTRARRAVARPKPKKAPPAKLPKPVPVTRPPREELEEETVCSIEFLSDNRSFVARLDTQRGGMREHKAPSFTDLLELVAEDLREEFLEA